MGYTVISSTPSPYARKVRINLIEQGIPFTLQTEVPWNKDTQTPRYNPLEKLPILIISPEDGSSSSSSSSSSPTNSQAQQQQTAIYESRVILEWLNTLGPAAKTKSLLPPADDPEACFRAKQIEALADGVCDALVLGFFEERRGEEHRSPEWADRQRRKVDGGLRALDEIVRGKEAVASAAATKGENTDVGGGSGLFVVGGTLSVADLAVGSLLGFLALRAADHPWRTQYPALERYWRGLEERESFKLTTPKMFTIVDKVV